MKYASGIIKDIDGSDWSIEFSKTPNTMIFDMPTAMSFITPAEAREIGKALLAAADELDRMNGVMR